MNSRMMIIRSASTGWTAENGTLGMRGKCYMMQGVRGDNDNNNVNKAGRNKKVIKHGFRTVFVMYCAFHVGGVVGEVGVGSGPVGTPLVRQAGQLFLPI